jgi:hypothetical protein
VTASWAWEISRWGAAGSPTTTLYDFEDYHWECFDEPQHAVVHLLRGKNMVAELLIDRARAGLVRYLLDVEAPQKDCWLFEVIVPGEPFPAAWFVFSHGLDADAGHELKH